MITLLGRINAPNFHVALIHTFIYNIKLENVSNY